MRNLFRLVLVLTFIFAMTVFVTGRIGAMSPIPSLQAWMSGPDGVACEHPCLFGVEPGVTTMEQAVLMLRSHPLTRSAIWQDESTLQLAGPAAYVMFSRSDDGLIYSISLSDNLYDTGVAIPGSLADSVTIGEIMAAEGNPSIGLPGSDYFVLTFIAAGITAASARSLDGKSRIETSTPLSMLMITVFRPCPTDGVRVELQPWSGFTYLERYFNDRSVIPIIQKNSGVRIPPFATCAE